MKDCIRATVALWTLGATVLTEPLFAQTAIVTKKATVTFSGELQLNGVYRSDEYFTARKGSGLPGNTGDFRFVDPGLTNAERVGGVPPRDGSEVFLDPYVRLNFEIDVGDQARGVIEVRTPFVNPDPGGKNNTPVTGFFDDFEHRVLEVKQVYAEIDEIGKRFFLGEGLRLRAGIMDFRKDLDDDGHAFLLGTAGAEHPFDARVPDPASPLFGVNTGSPPSYSAGFRDVTEPAGGYLEYISDFIRIDGWFFNLDERFNAANMPRDLLFWGFSATVPLGEGYRFGKVFLTVFDLMPTSNSHLVTEGGGILIQPPLAQDEKLLDLFGEIYFQQGTYARDVPGVGDIDQEEAFAIQAGLRARLPFELGPAKKFIPYLELSYVEVSGDDRSDDDTNSNFVSMEDNNRTLVVENGFYGYDIDTNYRGVRAAAGFHIWNVYVEALYAYFELQDNSQGRMAGGGGRSPKLGDEIDFTIGYNYSANLTISYSHGFLLDSKALGQVSATQIGLLQIILSF